MGIKIEGGDIDTFRVTETDIEDLFPDHFEVAISKRGLKSRFGRTRSIACDGQTRYVMIAQRVEFDFAVSWPPNVWAAHLGMLQEKLLTDFEKYLDGVPKAVVVEWRVRPEIAAIGGFGDRGDTSTGSFAAPKRCLTARLRVAALETEEVEAEESEMEAA